MLFFDGGLGLVLFAVWLFCIIDVITTPAPACRNLPKLLWLLIVVILPEVGSIAWLVAGRNWNPQARAAASDAAEPGQRHPVPTRPARASNPDDDEEFLASLRARAEEQRRRAREAQQRDEPPGPPSP